MSMTLPISFEWEDVAEFGNVIGTCLNYEGSNISAIFLRKIPK